MRGAGHRQLLLGFGHREPGLQRAGARLGGLWAPRCVRLRGCSEFGSGVYKGTHEGPEDPLVLLEENQSNVGVAQNSRRGVTQVLGFGSIYQGACFVPLFEPLPCVQADIPLKVWVRLK